MTHAAGSPIDGLAAPPSMDADHTDGAGRRQAIREAVDHAAHYLPAQGPIGVFVHHNTLHAFEDQPFEEAELAPLVARVGFSVSETAPASRAGHVVSSVHSPAGNVFFTVGVETAF